MASKGIEKIEAGDGKYRPQPRYIFGTWEYRIFPVESVRYMIATVIATN